MQHKLEQTQSQPEKPDTELLALQAGRWPQSGRHILASYDDASVVVYQAYRTSIGTYAAEHGHFGGPDFTFSRMSWIKPNFLWMMYRSGWGTKQGQEVTLALRLRRTFFDSILAASVASTFDAEAFKTHDEWQRAVAGSDVRLQWDPDHDVTGRPLQRRAVQLGLRGEVLEAFGRRELLDIQDISNFVASQRALIAAGKLDRVQTPLERIYLPSDPMVRSRLGLEVAAA